MQRTYIIAEAGVNHNGDKEIAKKMILEAKNLGADAVKFQTFKSENLVSVHAHKTNYQLKTTDKAESQLEMLKKLELSYENFKELSEYSKKVGIDFLSTPFDIESLFFLQTLKMPYWKIPSGEITNKPFLIEISKTRIPIIMSTGMSTFLEIQEALALFKQYSNKDIILLHCNTEYPTPYVDVNLKAMEQLKIKFNMKVGYSDHTAGIEIPIAAVAMGAVIIEKHFTLDRNMKGPDHKASLEPHQFAEMVKCIRNIEVALGSGIKRPSQSEMKNISIVRKSVVARQFIAKGAIFTGENITAKRPGDGLSPMLWDEIIGKTAKKNFYPDDKIEI